MPFYFAYGSNMSPAQMAERCPGARALGAAALQSWRFHITTRGSASIRPDPDGVVHGVLWRCDAAHFHALDRYEGLHWGNYHRRLVLVDGHGGGRAHALTYVSPRRYPGRARLNYMVTAVIPGARAFGLPEPYIDELHSWLPVRTIGERQRRYRGRTRPLRFPR